MIGVIAIDLLGAHACRNDGIMNAGYARALVQDARPASGVLDAENRS